MGGSRLSRYPIWVALAGLIMDLLFAFKAMPICETPPSPSYCDPLAYFAVGSLIAGLPFSLYYYYHNSSVGKQVEIPLSEVKPHLLTFIELNTGRRRVLRVNAAARKGLDLVRFRCDYLRNVMFSIDDTDDIPQLFELLLPNKGKSHKVRNILVILGVFFVAIIILGAVALTLQGPTGAGPTSFQSFTVTGSDSIGYTVVFALQDSSQRNIAAAGTVSLVITNSNGAVTYYSHPYNFAVSDYSTFEYLQTGTQLLGVSWIVPANSFTPQPQGPSQWGEAKITFTPSRGIVLTDTVPLVNLA